MTIPFRREDEDSQLQHDVILSFDLVELTGWVDYAFVYF